MKPINATIVFCCTVALTVLFVQAKSVRRNFSKSIGQRLNILRPHRLQTHETCQNVHFQTMNFQYFTRTQPIAPLTTSAQTAHPSQCRAQIPLSGVRKRRLVFYPTLSQIVNVAAKRRLRIGNSRN